MVTASFGEPKDIHLVDDRRSRVGTHLLEPIRDPVLLWKETYQAAIAGPGPDLHDWQTSLWRPSMVLLGSLAVGSGILLYTRPELWGSTMATLNVFLGILTVLVAAITSGLLAFRSGASISGERELQTLDALRTLPIERSEILRAKWLGTVYRYRLCIYALLTIWSLGLVTGALHPLAIVCLAIVCSAHFAFLISIGIWLSEISRNTLWAHMRLATILLVFFCGAFLGLLDNHAQDGTGHPSLANRLMGIGLVPECSWWFTSFSWVDSTGRRALRSGAIWPHVVDTIAGAFLFGGAAWLFWRLTCRRWKETLVRKKSPVQPKPQTNGATPEFSPPCQEEERSRNLQ